MAEMYTAAKLAEKLGVSQGKVKKVLLDGKLDISGYTDKDGQERTSFTILADTYRLL
jgi:single-stranded DNA-binding protein